MTAPLALELTTATFVAALARASGLAFTAPLIGDRGTSVKVRLVFAVAVAAVLTAHGHGAGPAADPALVLATVPVELGGGLLVGVTARFILERVATGAQLVGLHAGLGFAQSFDPAAGESASDLRRLVAAIAGLAFLAADGLEALVRAVALPLGPMVVAEGLRGAMDAGIAVFAAAIGVAAPVLLAATIANLGLALINRAVPGVSVFSLSLPVILLLAGVVLLATATITAGVIDRAASDAVAAVLGVTA